MKIDIRQLEFIDSKLREIALAVEAQFDVDFTITSIYRIGDNGVHGALPCRGLDLRCRDDHFGRLIEDFVNTHWQYDPERENMKCCMYHDVGSGKHIHLQTHPNTVRVTTP
jgi:hypothetical protein